LPCASNVSLPYCPLMTVPATTKAPLVPARKPVTVALSAPTVSAPALPLVVPTPVTTLPSWLLKRPAGTVSVSLRAVGVSSTMLIVSIALAVVVVWWAFTPPYYEFAALTVTQMANITLFAFSAGLIVWLAVVYRNLLATLEQQEKHRSLLVGEIEHRSKNFLTVVESLIHQTIDDSHAQPLINRIRAVVSTQDILDASSKRTADLRTILAEELGSYGSERVRLDGPSVQLDAATARAVRLVFHELATNALKHGALSEPNGKIAVAWRLQSPQVQLDWREMDGPKVAEPASYNFGSKLITRTLKQLNAKFEPTFAETGYCYRMTIPLAESSAPGTE